MGKYLILLIIGVLILYFLPVLEITLNNHAAYGAVDQLNNEDYSKLTVSYSSWIPFILNSARIISIVLCIPFLYKVITNKLK